MKTTLAILGASLALAACSKNDATDNAAAANSQIIANDETGGDLGDNAGDVAGNVVPPADEANSAAPTNDTAAGSAGNAQ